MATDSTTGLCKRVENLLDAGVYDITIDVRPHIWGLREMIQCKSGRLKHCTLIVTYEQKHMLTLLFQYIRPSCDYKFIVPKMITVSP